MVRQRSFPTCRLRFLLRAHEEFVLEEDDLVVGVVCLGESHAVQVVLGVMRHGAEGKETTNKDET